jgi:hypothetical protein
MRADEFIQKLTEIAPSTNEIINQVCPGDLAIELRNSYFVPKKQEKIYHENPLIKLSHSYDFSN